MANSPFSIIIPALIAGAAMLGGCSGESRFNTVTAVDIVRLDRAIEDISDTAGIAESIYDGADAWIYATRMIPPGSLHSSVRDSLLRAERYSSAFQFFQHDVDSLLPSLASVSESLGRLDGFPARVYGMVSPFNQSIITVDTVVIIALNHYLGSGYEGYASFPDYLRRNKTVDRLPIDVGEAWIRSRYSFPDSILSPTLLQRMAYEGAVIAETADELSIADGPLLLGWTQEEWNGALANEKEAWRRIVAGELLFSDDFSLIGRLMSPAPSSPDVSPDAPGRLGRFIGLRLIRECGLDPHEVLSGKAYLDSSIIGPYARSMSN